MFFSNKLMIKQLTFRRNLLQKRNEVGNMNLINKLNRRLRKLEA